MRAASLLVLFILAKVVVLSGHTLPLSFWMPVAYLWQDLLVVLLFAALDSTVQKFGVTTRLTWVIYWAVAIYTALNIPVGRALSTPLTWPMLRAARGPLSDSLLLYVTWQNVLLMVLTIATAAILPFCLQKMPRHFLVLAAACAIPIVTLGPMASTRVETLGLDRNVLMALMTSGLPRAHSQPDEVDWRVSRFDQATTDDLSKFRGIAKDRNVVLVSLESTAAQYLSLYGAEYEVTPNLSALARNAVIFENAYAAYPESIKGLFSILCSIFPAFDSEPEAYEKAPCQSVAAAVAKSGYRTGLFHSGRFAYLGMESIILNRGYQTLEDAGDIGGNQNSSFGVDEPSTISRILSWIDALPRGQRFFLTYLPIAGHHPYETPERGPFSDRDEISRYRNALHYGDAALGTLVEGLRARGLEQHTLWVIFGDHGEAFGQHEGNYGHTFFLYDENVRIPFVIVAPGLMDRQVRVRNVVSLVDTAPTILDLVGISVPPNYQGRSMLDSAPRMALFFADYSIGMLGLRDGPWKFVYELDSRRSRMFDLDHDAHERTDVSMSNPERAAWYGRIVQGWSSSQKSYVARWNESSRQAITLGRPLH
jgi:glucan phosphoethanolaminetransferase (alkaline phosphatase superfamily)